MTRCPRCHLDLTLDTHEPKRGEVWLLVESGLLYEVTREYERRDGGLYGTAERLHPRGPQGCDPQHMLAMWPASVRAGEWVRVRNVTAATLLPKRRNEAMSARVMQVIETKLERRGDGKDARSPVRIVTQYWSLEGELLAEVDPCAEVLPVESAMYQRRSVEEFRRGTPNESDERQK
jgi:hypothetical protein